ncbi:choline-sulfatase [Novosphingobium sp. fls2-241-R2A-195]|jgi:choline-sulfatase|uniref:choline-sulfatase n=1 Tax=Novosphingobium sp. fls2-241-R2A-195 TaxID=3040296 RepID=UPI00254FCDD9|nr:choline-sulfatase [Novosphingobium sp. fls2-241-R2A-195]
MTQKQNFLLIMADQLAAGALPFLGASPVKAPNLARLAGEGVLFRSAYCNSPLCAPSRFSMLSGRLPSRIGAYDNACEFTATTPTIAHHLRLGGYRTILSGKMHFVGPDQLHGFEERLTTDIYPADFGWTPDWTNFEERPTWYHSMDSVRTAGPTVRTNQIDFDEEVVFTTRRKLFDIVRNGEGDGNGDRRPFFLVASLTHPHDPFAIHRKYWDLYEDVEIDLPRVTPPLDDLDPHSRRLRHVCGNDLDPVTDKQVRAARRAYYGAISFVDEQIGLILDTLTETGLAENTTVIVCSDHGEMLGERGLWYKMNFLEGGSRVPLIVSAPGRIAPRAVDESVSLLDLFPTLLDLAGLEPELAAPIDGHSLVPHLQGTGGHDEVIGEYLAEGAIAPIVMIRRGQWKFIHSPTDPDQLYDLSSDPDELRNLAQELQYADLIAEFRAEVARRWDLAAIERDVIDSQRRRRIVAAANATGRLQSWDWNPPRDASREYIRSHMDLEALEAVARFPQVRTV